MKADELVKGIARRLLVDMGPSKMSGDEFIAHCERTLRKAGLAELLDAGQAMRDMEANNRWDRQRAWDAAMKKLEQGR